jgi:hypothetical protein
MPLKVLQIVPRLPPAITGVGDYAYLLAKELRASHSIETSFLVCDPSWDGGREFEGFVVERLETRTSGELETKLSANGMPSIVLLHYVGYGYEKRGCPLWLTRGLDSWKRLAARRRLVIMFHELYAFGPPWRSSFWASYLQRRLVAWLATLADYCITNMRRFADWLVNKEVRHKHRLDALPVFSTIGEVTVNWQLSARAQRMIIFGGAKWATSLLEQYQDETLACCRALGMQEIVTIGSPMGTAPVNLPIQVTEKGFLSANEIVDLISTSRVGLMDYFPGYLAKSSVYAAYAALGILPILPSHNPSEADGCKAGVTYLIPDQIKSSMSVGALQQVADNAREWYRKHNLSHTALAYAKLLRECQPLC